jgi:hypothetical protein
LNNANEGSHRPTRKRGDIRPVQVTSAAQRFRPLTITLSLMQAATSGQWINLMFRPHQFQPPQIHTATSELDSFSLWAELSANNY